MARSQSKGEWRKPGRRQGYRVLAPERHLIVCEGKKTEPLYFSGMRDALRPEFRNRIHIVVKGTGLHTTDLLDYALRECRLSAAMTMFGLHTTAMILIKMNSTQLLKLACKTLTIQPRFTPYGRIRVSRSGCYCTSVLPPLN